MCAIKIEHLPKYKLADYRLWKGEWELIHGIPYAMSPSASLKHQKTARNILLQLQNELDAQNCTCEIYYELDLIIDDRTVVRPDLMIFCKELVDYPTTPPLLIVEILSTSTRRKDLGPKLELYQSFGVSYYIIVDPDQKTVVRYRLNNDAYEPYDENEPVLLKDCSITLSLQEII